jgi:hypothetical protein
MNSEELMDRVRSAGEVEVERFRIVIGRPLDPRVERMIREASGNAYINGLRHTMCAIEAQQDLVPLCEFLDEIEEQPNWHKTITFRGDEWKNS